MEFSSELSRLTYYRGRVAMAAILKGLGVGKDDLVATQAFTCLAVPEGIMAVGARPWFVDTEPGSVNMSADDLRSKLVPGLKAIVLQHTFGIPAQVDAIAKIAEENGIPLIEDCCHALSSTFRGKRVGEFGVGAFYSFEWGKPIVVGIGGSAIVHDAELHQQVDKDYVHFRSPIDWTVARLQLQYAGFNALYRPSRYWQVRSLFQRLSRSGAATGNYNKVGEVSPEFRLRMPGSLKRRLENKSVHLDEIGRHSDWVTNQYAEIGRAHV